MAHSNTRKSQVLGMPFGTAAGRLRKSVMFMLVRKAGLDACYRCGRRIADEASLTIEHKKPWEKSKDPQGLFFDLDNIAFSHHGCNMKARRYWVGPKYSKKELLRACEGASSKREVLSNLGMFPGGSNITRLNKSAAEYGVTLPIGRGGGPSHHRSVKPAAR